MRISTFSRRIRSKGVFFWVQVFILIPVGMYVGSWVERRQVGMEYRYQVYQVMEWFRPHTPTIQRTAVVLVGDEDYWRGELERRVPIKRGYLARLIRALDEKTDPTVIAIDFDLRSPTPDGSIVEHDTYKKETQDFLLAVKDVSKNRPVVLPETVEQIGGGFYTPASDVHDGFDFGEGKVARGYIQLPYDYRVIPLGLKMKSGEETDSFAEAIVRFDNPAVLHPATQGEGFPYGSYLPVESFKANHLVDARDVLNGDPAVLAKLHHKVVIIGAGWSRTAYQSGGFADSHLTPVGQIPGVFMHANYVEALIDHRVYGHWGDRILEVLEFVFVLLVAAIFAVAHKTWTKTVALLCLCLVVLPGLSYLSWINLGRFFDCFVPMILILAHAALEQVREWRADAHKFARFKLAE